MNRSLGIWSTLADNHRDDVKMRLRNTAFLRMFVCSFDVGPLGGETAIRSRSPTKHGRRLIVKGLEIKGTRNGNYRRPDCVQEEQKALRPAFEHFAREALSCDDVRFWWHQAVHVPPTAW